MQDLCHQPFFGSCFEGFGIQIAPSTQANPTLCIQNAISTVLTPHHLHDTHTVPSIENNHGIA